MDTVAQILTKKNYGTMNKPADSEAKPLWLKMLFVLFITAAAMGEWKVINFVYEGIPKAITLGAIALAFLYGIIKNDVASFKKIIKPAMVYISLLLMIMLCSLVIWVLGFTNMSSITRGGSKMLFQLISVLVAISGVFLFGKESIKLFFISICSANGAIMLLELPTYGLAASIESLWQCIVGFGDAYGYSRRIEIHDITFVMGQFAIYYAVFAPSTTKDERKERAICLALSIFFFVVGLKRIALPTVALVIVIGLMLKNRKNLDKIVVIGGVASFFFFFYFLYIVQNGQFIEILKSLGIDTMGRDKLWALARNHYELSPSFTGLGFEAVDAIVDGWYQDGLLSRRVYFHNDILKVFVELGFYGFSIWTIMQYVIFPVFWTKRYNATVAFVYMCLLMYMSVTYMTDNTAFYFWSTMIMRLIPLACAYDADKTEIKPKWEPPSQADVASRVKELCRERG